MIFFCSGSRCDLSIKAMLSPCFKQTTHSEDVWEIGDLAPHILSPGTRWRGVVSFIFRSLYSRGLSSRNPLAQSLGGPQTRNVRRKMTRFVPNSAQLMSVYSGDCKGISLWHGYRYRYILVVSCRLDLTDLQLHQPKQKQLLTEERDIRSGLLIQSEVAE